MDEEINVTKEVLKRVDVLAKEFGETGAELWRVYVAETQMLGVSYCVACVVLALGSLVAVVKGFAVASRDKNPRPRPEKTGRGIDYLYDNRLVAWEDDTDRWAIAVPLILIGCVGLIVSAVVAHFGLVSAFAPSKVALDAILK